MLKQESSIEILQSWKLRKELYAEENGLRTKFEVALQQLDVLAVHKDEIEKAMTKRRQELAHLRTEIRKLTRSIGFAAETELDDRIVSLEL